MDQVSNTLMIMQNFMIKKGLFQDSDTEADEARTRTPKYDGKNKSKSKADIEATSNSDTTTYHNVLKEANPNQDLDAESEENEVLFIIREPSMAPAQRCDSMSSEDKIDTSDELMEVNCDKFIADCREEARRQSAEHQRLSSDKRKEFLGDRLVREAKAARVRM